MRKAILAILIFSSMKVAAEVEYGGPSKVVNIISYNSYGGGDVVFKVNQPTTTCHGYWISKSDPGYEANVSSILSAFHSKATVKASGLNDQKWPGSSTFWCKLYAIEFIQ